MPEILNDTLWKQSMKWPGSRKIKSQNVSTSFILFRSSLKTYFNKKSRTYGTSDLSIYQLWALLNQPLSPLLLDRPLFLDRPLSLDWPLSLDRPLSQNRPLLPLPQIAWVRERGQSSNRGRVQERLCADWLREITWVSGRGRGAREADSPSLTYLSQSNY